MGFYVTEGLGGTVCECREKTHPPSKNRVVGARRFSADRARLSAPQTLEPHREKQPTPTTTASGVRFYGYRFYSPELGRWVSRDPIEEGGSPNVNGFVRNDPCNLVDMLGLHCRCVNVSPVSEDLAYYEDYPNGEFRIKGKVCPGLTIADGGSLSDCECILVESRASWEVLRYWPILSETYSKPDAARPVRGDYCDTPRIGFAGTSRQLNSGWRFRFRAHQIWTCSGTDGSGSSGSITIDEIWNGDISKWVQP